MRFLRASSAIAGAALTVAIALGSLVALAPRAEGPKVRFSVTYGAAASATPLDGRLLLLISKDAAEEPRLQITDSVLRSQQIFGVDVDGWKAGAPAVFEGDVLGFPARSLEDLPAGKYRVQALLPSLRDVPARRRPRRQAPDGSRRGSAVEQGSGQPLLDAERGRDRSREGRDDRDRPRPGHPADPGAGEHEVRQAREAALRAALEVLGPSDVPRRARPAARGLRHAPERPLSPRHQPRPLSGHDRRLARGAGGSESGPQVLRAVPPGGLQPHRAGAGLSALQGLDRPRLSALPPRRDPARQPVLRRFVRGELAEPRPVRRRHHARADPLPREEVPGDRRRLGAVHVRRLHRRMGGARARRSSTRTSTTAAGPRAPTRSTSASTPW